MIFSIILSHLTALAINKTPKGILELKKVKKIDFLFIDSWFIYVLTMENDYTLTSAQEAALEESQLQIAAKSVYSKQTRQAPEWV